MGAVDVLEQIPGEAACDRLVRALLLGVDCSELEDPARYERTVLRPVDRTPQMRAGYFGNSRMSTCQLEQCAAWRIAGVPDAEVTGHEPLDGGISARQRDLCERYGSWVSVGGDLDAQAFAALMTRGRGWWIDDGSGLRVHAGSCVTDAIIVGAMTVVVDTVEGGQMVKNPTGKTVGYTATRRYTHTWTRGVDGRWRASAGGRHIIAIQLADKLPIPVTAEIASGEVTGDLEAPQTLPTGASTRGESPPSDTE